MILWWKKATLIALGVLTFSVAPLFAAVEYSSYISDLYSRLQGKIMTDNTNYEKYSSVQKKFISSELNLFKESALTFQKSYIATGKTQDKELFGMAALTQYSSEISGRVSIPSTPPEIKLIANDLIQPEVSKLGIELSDEAQGGSANPDGTGGVIPGDAQKPASGTQTDGKTATPECKIVSGFSLKACIDAFVGTIIQFTLVNLALLIFYFSGIFLHFAIAFGIVSFKGLIGDITTTSSNVYTLWLLVRNLVWTGILFSFFYLAILQLFEKKHEFGRAVAMIIVFALFSGFSFRISLFFIDISNVMTVTLYKQIDSNDGKALSNWDTKVTSEPLIATSYMKLLGYQNFSDRSLTNGFSGTVENSILGTEGGGGKIAIMLIFATTMLFNAYVMLMMGILFTVRDIALFAGVVLSPLLLVDRVIPLLSEPAQKFRKLFIGQLVFAPVFMLALFIGLTLSKTISESLQGVNTSGAFGVKIFNLIAVSAIFYFTYKYCKELSGALGTATLGALGGLAQRAMIATPLGLAGRATSVLGQNTLGALGRRLSREGGYLDRNRSKFLGLGEKAFNAARYSGNIATYDFNNSRIIANAGSALGNFAGNKNAFSVDGNIARIGKGNSYEDKQKNVRERLKYINETYTDEGDRERAVERAIGDGSLLDYTRPGGITLVGDKVLSKITKKAQSANDEKGDLRAFAKETRQNAEKKPIRDSLDAIDFENEEFSSLVEKIEKLRKKINIGKNPNTKKYFNELLKKKLTSFFSKQIESKKVLKKENGDPIVLTDISLDDLRASTNQFMNAQVSLIEKTFEGDNTLSPEENQKSLENFTKEVISSIIKSSEDTWKAENRRQGELQEAKKAQAAQIMNQIIIPTGIFSSSERLKNQTGDGEASKSAQQSKTNTTTIQGVESIPLKEAA